MAVWWKPPVWPRRLRSGLLLLLLLLLLRPEVGQADGSGEFVCFVYHRFGDDRHPSTNVALDVFATLEGFRQKSRMRALRVIDHRLRSPLLTGPNPPTLELRMDTAGLNAAAVRFFVQGRPQSLQRPDPADPARLLLRADAPLTGRRALYTLTAPSIDGRVRHWFSHVWVQPDRTAGHPTDARQPEVARPAVPANRREAASP